jgi:glutathione S-transferase
MITLYHLPNSRSSAIIWLLEELQVPYETRTVSGIRRADGSGARITDRPAYRKSLQ